METMPLQDTPLAPTGSDKIWSILSHLSALLGVGIILPLVVYLAMRGDSQYVASNAREALNFHLSLLIYTICCVPLVFVVIGIPLLILMGLGSLVLAIVAAVKAADGVENLTKTFTGDKIDNLLGPFTDFLKQNQEPLTETIANVRDVTKQIRSGQGTVGRLIYEDALYASTLTTVSNLNQNLTQTSDEVRAAIADARKIVNEINAGQGTVGKLVKDDKLYNEATASMTNLKEILQKINRGEGSVGKLVNDDSLIKNAKLTLQKLDKATEGLEDQGPLSVLGMAVGNLF